jgi:hypothetical protein
MNLSITGLAGAHALPSNSGAVNSVGYRWAACGCATSGCWPRAPRKGRARPIKDKLKRFELFERFGAENFYPTLGTAVDAYLHEHPVDWEP